MKKIRPLCLLYIMYIFIICIGDEFYKTLFYLLNQRMLVNARGERTAGIVVKPK